MSNSSEKTTGRVKWFNKNAGFGFITAVDGDHSDEDIFVHHTQLTVEKDQFRYLVDGEYVTFVWSDSGKEDENHKWHATNVTGICSGPLLCETQNESRLSSSSRDGGGGEGDSDGNGEGSSSASRSRSSRRYRGGGPHFTDANGDEYRLVRNRNSRGGRQQSNGASANSSSPE